MKKQLLLLSMVSVMALVGCDVTQLEDNGNQIIVKLNNGTAYTANDLFDKYSSTSAGASAYYNAVYDVLISEVQPNTNAIENAVSEDMDSFPARYPTEGVGICVQTPLIQTIYQMGLYILLLEKGRFLSPLEHQESSCA